jgi:Na+-driven multidrug efflux pump
MGIFLIFRRFFVGLYVSGKEAVMREAYRRMLCIMVPYFLCGIMEVLCATMRGMGKSISSMVISLLGACVFRIIWLETVFKMIPCVECIYFSYPVSWLITIAAYVVCLCIYYRRLVAPSVE